MIYNEFYTESKKNMLDSIATYDESWKIEPYDGCSPNNLLDFENKFVLPDTHRYKETVNKKKYISKKCCFYSHYSLWDYCAENLDYIVIVENDVEAAQKFPIKFFNSFIGNRKDSVGIQITTETAALLTKGNKKHLDEYYKHNNGIHPIYHKVNKTGKRYFIGATGYILNNKACNYLITNCKTSGWTQNDLLFNADDDFDLFFIKPSIAKYVKQKENRTSSITVKDTTKDDERD
jgi:GR25 family glycosyltransferase involved in LPS biosynthesis